MFAFVLDATPGFVAVAVIVLIALWLVTRITGRRLEAKVGDVAVIVEDARQHAAEVNRAVNQRPPHEPTIYELVAAMSADMKDIRRDQELAGARLESLKDSFVLHLGTHRQQSRAPKEPRE